MKPQTTARVVAALVAIILSTWFSYHYRTRAQQIGRDTYVAEQAKRYDRSFARPSLISAFTGSVVFWGGVFIAYEGVSAALYKLMSRQDSETQNI